MIDPPSKFSRPNDWGIAAEKRKREAKAKPKANSKKKAKAPELAPAPADTTKDEHGDYFDELDSDNAEADGDEGDENLDGEAWDEDY